jgi:asparagine synthetase B (glutamine-hydrolysing)
MNISHSLELRVPFLDKELVGLAFKMSDKDKLISHYLKSMMTKSFSEFLPDEIVFR